jgi:hypothetical protein
VSCLYVADIFSSIDGFTERCQEENDSGVVGIAVSSFGSKTLAQDTPVLWNPNIRCRVHKNQPLVHMLSGLMKLPPACQFLCRLCC